MITLRRANERGSSRLDWLESYHTFSFSHYRDPAWMGFSVLRVINDDIIAPGGGFATHGHRDMEIITYVLEGALAHKDSLGTGSVILPGDVQRMSAGRGIEHSEFNASDTAPVHLLQIWILPNAHGLAPSYEQKDFSGKSEGALRLVASPDGAEDSVTIHQDARMYAGVLTQPVEMPLSSARNYWLHVARGEAMLGNTLLKAGDGVAIAQEQALRLVPQPQAEMLLFDLP